MRLRARLVERDDLMLAYRWANDPLNRAMNFKQGMIPLDTFTRLFTALLRDEDVLFLIIEGLSGDTRPPIAQVRVYADGAISLSVDEKYRGKRLATPVIRAAVEFAREKLLLDEVTATIWHKNIASIRAFEGAGFRYKGDVDCAGHECVEYVYVCGEA